MARSPRTVLPFEDQAEQAVEERLLLVSARFVPELRERVSQLLLAAAQAILQLTDLDLVHHEGDEAGQHSVAMWEELAPVMSETVQSVNAMIATAEEAFPPPAATADALDNLDDAFGPEDSLRESEPEPSQTEEEEIASLVAAVASGLRRDVARLGERLRNPTVVADPWNLTSDLLEFRGRLRAGLSELIFQVATRVDESDRSAVVPGYAADLETAALVRQASTNLSFLFRGHAKRIAGSSDERIGAALIDALKDLQSFSRTRALPSLRTADKRIFLETRAELVRLMRSESASAQEIKLATENMARFLDSLSVISRRENLRLHDRAQLAAAGRKLEQAQAALDDPPQARAHLASAVRSAAMLYGRDAQLDAYVRAQRHFAVDWLSDTEVAAESERFGALLAGIVPP